MVKALLYERKKEGKVRCLLCPHFCIIRPGSRGICGVRKNIDGELFSLNSDKIVAATPDPIEKKPLFHFLPSSRSFSIASSGCNFHCDFCQNHSISIVNGEKDIQGQHITPDQIIDAAVNSGCKSIAYTYTEPTIFFELMKSTAEIAKARGLKNVMISNGFISSEALEIISPYIDGANIDVKSFSDFFYRKYCRGGLKPVLETVRSLKNLGIWIELTTLIVPGLNTDLEEIKKLIDFILDLDPDTPWHVSRFFPVYKAEEIKPTETEFIENVLLTAKKSGLKYLYGGNFNSDIWESTFCPSCGSELIKREGYRTNIKNLSEGKCEKCGTKIPGVWN